MNLPGLCIRRPVMTTLVMAGILIFGLLAWRQLPISDLPRIDFPTISVSARLAGADPETMAASVATPLERQFSTIAGIDSMTSSSTLGSTSITLQFELDRDIDAAAQDVQAAISAAQRQLPADMPTPPTWRKINPTEQPILLLALRSDTLPLSRVNEYADTLLAQRISMLSGVAQVSVYGSQKYAVRVQADPDKLAGRDLAIDDIARAIDKGNSNRPTGTLWGKDKAWSLRTDAGLDNADGFRRMIVAWRAGTPVHLEDVASVFDSVENNKVASWYNDTRAIVLAVQRQPGTNTVEIVDNVRKLLPELQTMIPASVQLDVLIDRSLSIRASVADVEHTLLLTAILVVLVIFLFLRRLSATVIPALSLPLSLIGTFAGMWLLGFSLDNLSLMALTLATGFVVDDAIVVLENIVRRMEEGESPRTAAIEGSRQVAFTVLSMTISLAAVFIPILFMTGIVGRLFREFAVTMVLAIGVSGVVSLTLIPMLCSRFLRPASIRHGLAYRASEALFTGMHRTYEWLLDGALRHQGLVLLSLVLSIVFTGWLYTKVPKGFIPTEDIGQLRGNTECAQGVSFAEMVRHQQLVAAKVLENPNVASFMSNAGNDGSNQGRFFIRLKDASERTASPEEVIDQLRKATAPIVGIKAYFQNPPPIQIGGQQSKGQYQYTVQGSDTTALYASAAALEAKLREIPEITDISSNLQLDNPRLEVHIDRERAAALGVSPGQVEATLGSAYGSQQVSTILTSTNQYQVILEVAPEYQADPTMLARLHLRPDGGNHDLIPLATIASISPAIGPLSINHQGQTPAVTLAFNLKTGASIGDVVPKVETLAATTLGAGITGGFAGSAQAFQSSLAGMGILLMLAIAVIYLVLGILYESFIHPLTILSGLPSAGIGALLALWLCKDELNIYAFVGIIMLIGIVKKNAIMMVDFAIQARVQEGLDAFQAIRRGCLVRFRPIMMTTMAALMGTIPLAVGLGTVSHSRRSLGIAIVGGLLLSQLITLFVTPVVYLALDRFQEWLRRPAPPTLRPQDDGLAP
jgi:HAE1 family hydrophobic/amphiphilic exporter-1